MTGTSGANEKLTISGDLNENLVIDLGDGANDVLVIDASDFKGSMNNIETINFSGSMVGNITNATTTVAISATAGDSSIDLSTGGWFVDANQDMIDDGDAFVLGADPDNPGIGVDNYFSDGTTILYVQDNITLVETFNGGVLSFAAAGE